RDSFGPTGSGTRTVSGTTPVMSNDASKEIASLVRSLGGGDRGAAAARRAGGENASFQAQNMQDAKEPFLAKARSRAADDDLRSARTAPRPGLETKPGGKIPAVLEQALNSDLPGELKALVTSNIYDTATGRFLLIPQGSRLVGVYDSRIGCGQDGA